MAVRFPGGVILGADSRTTTGAYIANRVTDKLTPLYADSIYCCRSGSAADTQAIADIVHYYLQLTEVEQGKAPSVKQAAVLMRQLCYSNKDALLAGVIVAGWDAELGGQVYSIPLGGSLHPAPYAIGGSGSTYIFGYCDSVYRHDMNAKECEEFVVNALSIAMARDGSSGGVIRLAIITQGGVERKVFRGRELPVFWKD